MASNDDQLELNLQFGDLDLPEPIFPDILQGILGEIWVERGRQDEKWGAQNHPVFTRIKGTEPASQLDRQYLATALKAVNDRAVKEEGSQLGWDTILGEELAEAFEKAYTDWAHYREELVQSAAVIVAMIEHVDRETGNTNG